MAMQPNSNLLTKLTIAVSLAALPLVCARPARTQAGGHVEWSPSLQLHSLAGIPRRLREPVLDKAQPTLAMTHGEASHQVSNCEEYLSAVNAGFSPANNYEQKRSAAFVGLCYVLRDLQHARPVVSGNAYGWTADSLAQLPPVLVPGARDITDAAAQAEQRGQSWRQFNPALKVTKADRDQLFAGDPEYAYSLEILARADFNGDGAADIAVFGCVQGKHSTWSPCEYFIFSLAKTGKLVRLTQSRAPYLLRARISN
jgi:hypothetical protein